MLVSPAAIARSVLANFSSVVPLPASTPNMPATWPIATWMPTPVRKPMRTLRDRKLAMKPSLQEPASEEQDAAHQRGEAGQGDVLGRARRRRPSPARPAARIAAVAESAPTTRWRDEPKMANRRTGSSSV